MTPALAALVAGCLYAGFQWAVRVVVYPQLAASGRAHPAGFVELEAAHQGRVTRLVGPLFVLLALGTGWLLLAEPGRVSTWVCAAAAAGVVAVTALGAVPQHRALSGGFDEAAVTRLLRADTVRVVLASVHVVSALVAVTAR